MNRDLIFKELEKGDYYSRKSPNVKFETIKVGHYFIINLKNFPRWDTLLRRLLTLVKKYSQNLKTTEDKK